MCPSFKTYIFVTSPSLQPRSVPNQDYLGFPYPAQHIIIGSRNYDSWALANNKAPRSRVAVLLLENNTRFRPAGVKFGIETSTIGWTQLIDLKTTPLTVISPAQWNRGEIP